MVFFVGFREEPNGVVVSFCGHGWHDKCDRLSTLHGINMINQKHVWVTSWCWVETIESGKPLLQVSASEISGMITFLQSYLSYTELLYCRKLPNREICTS